MAVTITIEPNGLELFQYRDDRIGLMTVMKNRLKAEFGDVSTSKFVNSYGNPADMKLVGKMLPCYDLSDMD